MFHLWPPIRHTCTSDLKKVVLLKLFEHAPLDFNELVRHEECQECVIVRVDGNVKGDGLIDHHEGVHDYEMHLMWGGIEVRATYQHRSLRA